MSPSPQFRILIADRNRHVREFLRREFLEQGYRVEVARDGQEVLLWAETEGLDLLILDPETPYVGELEVLARLKERRPELPVVIYTFPGESAENEALESAAARLEKDGDTARLKTAVAEALQNYYPHRFRERRKA